MNRYRLLGTVACFFCSVLVLYFIFADPGISYENVYLLLLCRILFTGIIPITIAVLSVLAYSGNANIKVLMMGCGMLVFGLGSVVSALLRLLPDSINMMLSTNDICIFACAALHLSLVMLQIPAPPSNIRQRKIHILFAIVSAIFFTTVASTLAYYGFLPTFYGEGGSARLRDGLLWLSISFFLISAIMLNRNTRNDQSPHLFWYSLSLITISIGLFGVTMSPIFDSQLIWAGRIVQYVGLLFALVSMGQMLKKAKRQGVSPSEFMADFFGDAQSSYRDLVANIPSAILIVNTQYKVFFSNAAAQRLFRLSPEEFLSRTFPDTMLSERCCLALRGEVDSKKISSGYVPASQAQQLEVLDKDGRTIPVELTFSLCPMASGYACMFVIQDITERIIQQQKQELAAKADEYQRRNRVLTDFFTSISHEFKTPLTLILNMIELTEMRIKPIDFNHNEKVLRNLTVMRQNAHRLLRLIANLLDVTKMDAGFMRVNYQIVDLPQWISTIMQSVEDFAAQRGIQVTFRDESELQFIPMDSEKLDRIMLNLLSNAIKHTSKGGHIDIILSDLAGSLQIVVQDDGEGIPEGKQSEVFNRFYQVNTSLTRNSEGTGIGLALTKSLVDLLHGRIWFTSEPGKGTIFFVELPVIEVREDELLPAMDGLALNRKVEMEFSDII